MDLHPVPCTCYLRKLTVDAFLKNPEDLTSKVLKTCRDCRERNGKAYHAKKDRVKKRQFGDELDANVRPEKRSKCMFNGIRSFLENLLFNRQI